MPHRRRIVLITALAALTLAGCNGRQPPVAGGAGSEAGAANAPAAESSAADAAAAAEVGEAPAEAAAEPVAEAAPGPAAAAEPAATSLPPDGAMAGPPGSGIASGRPYVVIRFTESDVDYEPALAQAVREAVARKPGLAFDLVAVTPAAGSADDLAENAARARGQAQDVMQSLAGIGIGPERVSVGSWNGLPSDVNEIRLYIR